jgi:hypothetical protein
MILEGVEARESSQVPSFFFSLFLTELLESVKAECALLTEERRRKPLRGLASLGFWLLAPGLAALRGMGPIGPKEFEIARARKVAP